MGLNVQTGLTSITGSVTADVQFRTLSCATATDVVNTTTAITTCPASTERYIVAASLTAQTNVTSALATLTIKGMTAKTMRLQNTTYFMTQTADLTFGGHAIKLVAGETATVTSSGATCYVSGSVFYYDVAV